MIGDLLGGAARRKGITGVVVDGAVRDVGPVSLVFVPHALVEAKLAPRLARVKAEAEWEILLAGGASTVETLKVPPMEKARAFEGWDPHRHSGAGRRPEPGTDAISGKAHRSQRQNSSRHRFWVPGSSLREAPE
jgi:hypothetical protein